MRWTFTDGSVIETGGRVTGTAKAAFEMRAELDTPPVFVEVGPAPDGRVELDPHNDFLIDSFVRGIASWLKQSFETDYVRNLEDAPEDVQTLVRDIEATPDDPSALH